MVTELTQLTKEAHQALVKDGKVEQISEPMLVSVGYGEYGVPVEELHKNVERFALNYEGANAFMIGYSQLVDSGLLTPFVLYKVLE